MARLTREELLQRASGLIAQMPIEEHEIPELGGSVTVRGLSGAERRKVITKATFTKGPRKGEIDSNKFAAGMMAACVVDEQGVPFLDENDLELLAHLPAGLIDRLMGTINRLSGFGEQEEEALGKPSASQAVSTASASSSPSDSAA